MSFEELRMRCNHQKGSHDFHIKKSNLNTIYTTMQWNAIHSVAYMRDAQCTKFVPVAMQRLATIWTTQFNSSINKRTPYNVRLLVVYVCKRNSRIKFCILAFVISNAFLSSSLSVLPFYFNSYTYIQYVCVCSSLFSPLACSFAISTDQLQKSLQSTCRRQVVVIAAVAVNNSRTRKERRKIRRAKQQKYRERKLFFLIKCLSDYIYLQPIGKCEWCHVYAWSTKHRANSKRTLNKRGRYETAFDKTACEYNTIVLVSFSLSK